MIARPYIDEAECMRIAYLGLFPAWDAAVFHEEACLSMPRRILPPCAIAVLDGGEETADYWVWLAQQYDIVRGLESDRPEVAR